MNDALTDRLTPRVTWHAAVPLQSPLQPENVQPDAGEAARETVLPMGKEASQAPDAAPLVSVQAIPLGVEATDPEPVPFTMSVAAVSSNRAMSWVLGGKSPNVVHVPVPVQRPLQPANALPAFGVAVKASAIGVVTSEMREQLPVVPAAVMVQSRLFAPAPTTRPLPAPAPTMSICGATNRAVMVIGPSTTAC